MRGSMADTVTAVQDVHVCMTTFTTIKGAATILDDAIVVLANNGWVPTSYNSILGIPDYSQYVDIVKRFMEILNVFFSLYL